MNDKNNQENHHYGIDILRCIAVLFVIMIHVCDIYFHNYNSNFWILGNIAKCISRTGVQLFILISGYLLLNKTIEIGTFYKRRISKIFLPFIFFSYIYFICTTHGFNIYEFIKNFLNNKIIFHLWFMYPFIGLCISMPYIKKIVDNSTIKEKKYFILLFIMVSGIYPIIKSLFKLNYSFIGYFELNIFATFIGYAIIGGYLKKIQINKIYCIIAYAASTSIYFIYTIYLSYRDHTFKEDPYNLLTFIASLSIFIFFKDIKSRPHKLILEISKYSYGIYLIHVLIFLYLKRYINYIDDIHPIFTLCCLYCCVIICSYIIIRVCCLNAFLKKFIN